MLNTRAGVYAKVLAALCLQFAGERHRPGRHWRARGALERSSGVRVAYVPLSFCASRKARVRTVLIRIVFCVCLNKGRLCACAKFVRSSTVAGSGK